MRDRTHERPNPSLARGCARPWIWPGPVRLCPIGLGTLPMHLQCMSYRSGRHRLESSQQRLPQGRLMDGASAADTERTRFLVELEFVQSLANPHYLDWLAHGRSRPAPGLRRRLCRPPCEARQPARPALRAPRSPPPLISAFSAMLLSTRCCADRASPRGVRRQGATFATASSSGTLTTSSTGSSRSTPSASPAPHTRPVCAAPRALQHIARRGGLAACPAGGRAAAAVRGGRSC